MRIVQLQGNPSLYCCDYYFVLGDNNDPTDVNTLVDVGVDDTVLQQVLLHSTGIGKPRVEQIIMTHEHFDHAAGLKDVVSSYRPSVRAVSNLNGLASPLLDGEWLRLGDRAFKVLHTQGHSEDSICLYCPEEHVLFSGDLPVRINTTGGAYPRSLAYALQLLLELRIDEIYTGHQGVIRTDISKMLETTLRNVLASPVEPQPFFQPSRAR